MLPTTSIALKDLVREAIVSDCHPVDVRDRFGVTLNDVWNDDSFLRRFKLDAASVLAADKQKFDEAMLNFLENSRDKLVHVGDNYYDRSVVEQIKSEFIKEIETFWCD